MRATLLTATLFVAAGLVNLPVVYLVIAEDGAASPYGTLVFGLLSIGLAWAGGFVIERKWRAFVLAVGVLGVAEALLAMTPLMGDLAMGARPWAMGAGALSLAGVFAASRLGFPWMRRRDA